MTSDLERGRAKAPAYLPEPGNRDYYARPGPGSTYPMRWDGDPYHYVIDDWFGWAEEGLVPDHLDVLWDEIEDWDTAPLRPARHTAATGEWEDLAALVDPIYGDGPVTRPARARSGSRSARRVRRVRSAHVGLPEADAFTDMRREFDGVGEVA